MSSSQCEALTKRKVKCANKVTTGKFCHLHLLQKKVSEDTRVNKPPIYPTITDKQFASVLYKFKTSHEPFVIMCYAPSWCGPSRAALPIYESVKASSSVNVPMLLADEAVAKDVMELCNVEYYPSVFMFVKDKIIQMEDGVTFTNLTRFVNSNK
jgi:thiol-disulfide isomerase/thioredoxin